MIALVSELERGIENLWMWGKLSGRINYSNFGKETSRNYLNHLLL